MGEVIYLPGVEPQDAEPEEQTQSAPGGNAVLMHALTLDVSDVIVVGRQQDGSRFVSSGFTDNDKMIGVLMDAVTFLTNGVYDSETIAVPDPPTEPS